MGDLENQHAKPVMAGMIRNPTPISLQPKETAAIAAFAFKTAVITDAMHQRPISFFDPFVRYDFAATLQIPVGVHIWIGAHESLGGSVRTDYFPVKDSALKGFEFYCLTYVFGHLIIQLEACRWADAGNAPFPPPLVRQDDIWNDAMLPIWPPHNLVTWPPKQHLNHKGIETLRYRLRTLEFGIPL
jgi:hypothetical protein